MTEPPGGADSAWGSWPLGHEGSFRGPGEIIRQAIADGPRWMCQKYVARQAGISEKHLSQIVRGGVRMSAHVAVRLEGPLGVPALDLLVAQALVDIARAKQHRTS